MAQLSWKQIKDDLPSAGKHLTGSLNVTGSITLNGESVESGGSVDLTSVDYLGFNTSPITSASAQGTVSWNADELTLDLQQNGTILQVGQEMQYLVRNTSGVQIDNGTPVQATGTIGNSGRITVSPMDASVYTNSKFFLGLATEDIPDGADGKVTHFGKVRGVDTNAWPSGSVLWLDPENTGSLTNVEPDPPAMGQAVAFVINSANNGTLFVRVNNLNQHEFVHTNADSLITGSISISGSLDISNNILLGGELTLTNGGIELTGDPINGDGVGNRDYNDSRYLLSGSTTVITTWTDASDSSIPESTLVGALNDANISFRVSRNSYLPNSLVVSIDDTLFITGSGIEETDPFNGTFEVGEPPSAVSRIVVQYSTDDPTYFGGL